MPGLCGAVSVSVGKHEEELHSMTISDLAGMDSSAPREKSNQKTMQYRIKGTTEVWHFCVPNYVGTCGVLIKLTR
jgi:hypothetical protein